MAGTDEAGGCGIFEVLRTPEAGLVGGFTGWKSTSDSEMRSFRRPRSPRLEPERAAVIETAVAAAIAANLSISGNSFALKLLGELCAVCELDRQWELFR